MIKNFKFIYQYFKKYWFSYLLGIIALFVVDLLNAYIPKLTGEIVDGLTNQTFVMKDVLNVVKTISIYGFFIALGRFGWRFFISGSSRAITKDIRQNMFQHMESLPNRFYKEHKTGDLMAHFSNDLNSIQMMMGAAVISAFDASVMLILVLVQMLTYVSVKLTLIAVLPFLLICVGNYFYGKWMHKRFLEKQEAFSELSDAAQETVSGIRVIKSFVQEKRELYAFARINLHNKEKNLRVVELQALFMPLLDLIIGISSLLTLLYGGYLSLCKEITAGQFIAFNQYITMLVWPMLAVGECITFFSQGFASIFRIRKLMEEKSDIEEKGDSSIQTLQGAISIKDLSFSYPDAANDPVLSHISVDIPKGETLAVMGATGSGKTSLISLLLRIYDTDKECIFYDGTPIQKVPLPVLKKNIAYVPQENFLFSDTIYGNIAFGLKDASKEQVIKASKDAYIYDNIMDFPEAFDTVVGERGVTLSGGQKQRISIARALILDAPVLILDDSLSAVDTNTEKEILTNLKNLRKGKTTIIIAHRISTIEHADHCLVLENGCMKEYGSHNDLISQNGIYARIYHKQQLEAMIAEEGE